MPYKEKTEGWSFHEGEEGQTGTRVFVEDAGGNILSRPEVGDQFPQFDTVRIVGRRTDKPQCLCRGFDVAMYGEMPSKYIYTFHYSTKVEDDSDITGKSYGEDASRSFDLAGELLEINSPGKWKWNSDNAIIPFTGDDAVSITKRITTGSLTLEKVANNLPMDTILAITTKLNLKVFPNIPGFVGYPPGVWLCPGVSSREFLNEKGERRWRMSSTFLLKAVTGDPRDVTKLGEAGGWNFAWRKDIGKWDKPVLTSVTPNEFTYGYADFGLLFA